MRRFRSSWIFSIIPGSRCYLSPIVATLVGNSRSHRRACEFPCKWTRPETSNISKRAKDGSICYIIRVSDCFRQKFDFTLREFGSKFRVRAALSIVSDSYKISLKPENFRTSNYLIVRLRVQLHFSSTCNALAKPYFEARKAYICYVQKGKRKLVFWHRTTRSMEMEF